ncbi:MAG TPA: AAA family ATPase [Prolixibacteraceae bacterium]|nr:AAA family ATPase [Prolixibacteraceae bacterium]
MIPVQLTIQGLYSYQEKQTIDFTRLTAANLFGIFGSVGSGKSSILEAITFAIYGRTDRLNLSGDNRYYNMMNLKSNELLIDFIFETGKEQTAYRALVKGKRNGKNFDDVKTLERLAYQKNRNEWMPVEVDMLEQAIGLSYDNFKRTIIIPQGQFQEFLQLGNKDRTQMMKELFNLGKYEFYYKVASLESKNNAQKQLTEGQLQQLGAIEPEQLLGYNDQLVKLDNELKEMNVLLSGYQETEEAMRKLQLLMQRKAEAEQSLKSLIDQQSQYQELEKKITRYEQCVVQFKHLLDSLKDSQQRQYVREKQIRFDQEKLHASEEEILKLNLLLEELKPLYEKREELKQKAEELGHMLRIKTVETEIEKQNDRLKNGLQIYNSTLAKVEKLKIDKQQLEEQIKSEREKLPDLSLLSEIRAWHIRKDALEKQLQETDNEWKKQSQQAETIHQEVIQLLKEPLFDQLSPEANHEACVQYLQEQARTVKEKQKILSEQENHIRVKEQLKAYSENLEEGLPCPLCGSLHHPEVFSAGDMSEKLSKLEEEKRSYEKELDQISTFTNRLTVLENQLQLILRQLHDLEAKKKEQQQSISAHAAQFVWPKYREEAELNNAFGEANRIQAELKKHEVLLETLSKNLTQEENNKDRYQLELEKIKTQLTILQTEQKTIGGQLRLVQPGEYQQTPLAAIEEEKSALLSEYNRIEKEFTSQTNLLTELSKQQNTLAGSLQANQKEQEQGQQTIESLKNQLEEKLKKSDFQSVDEVSQLLSETFDPEASKQKLRQFNDQLLRSKLLLEQLMQEIGNQEYDQEAHQKLLGEVASLKEQLAQKNQEQGKIAELIRKLEKDLEIQAALQKELEQLELRAENIKTMKSLFKASGFVNYISSVYLQNLCNAANDRFFQLTRQKLSLEITEDNNFQVRDFMNGGKVRSVKTLSGGQTFQAALSLALALADNIQKITESNQNFFFLDEGFGSLDKESLSTVFETLKSLRKENRIVGVISHVEEMQQEIDVHLRIENHEEKGSIIRPSWKGSAILS